MSSLIPEHFLHTRSTPFWNRQTVPDALLTHHNTKEGVYARLSVMRGALRYIAFPDEHTSTPNLDIIIEAGQFGISTPCRWHRIELMTEDTYFNLDFFADPTVQLAGNGIGQVVNTHRNA